MKQPALQPDPEPEFLQEADLRALLDQTPADEPNYVIIQDEKPKRKGKPKPRLQLAPWLKISLLSGSVGFVVALVMFAVVMLMPASVSSPVPLNVNPVFIQPVPADNFPVNSDPLIDQWQSLGTAAGPMASGTNVRVMSADQTAGWYNVADMQGNLMLVNVENLRPASAAVNSDMHPPLGPFSIALGQNQRLLVTTEWNNGLEPGTAVYAMGWRAEDGTWIYEVSPDRVTMYYLPWQHLAPIQ
jgi:hypothetical protein